MPPEIKISECLQPLPLLEKSSLLTANDSYVAKFLTYKLSEIHPLDVTQYRLMPPLPLTSDANTLVSKSQRRWTYKPLWQCTVHLRVWPTRLPMARKCIAKVPDQTAAKRPNCFLLASEGLAQCCLNLSRWFTHETAANYTEQCTTLSPFHNFEVSQDACNHPLHNYGIVRWDAIFVW